MRNLDVAARNFTIIVRNFTTVVLLDLVLLVGNLGTISKFKIIVHKFKISPIWGCTPFRLLLLYTCLELLLVVFYWVATQEDLVARLLEK
jgi:hypothetical protein